MELYDLHEYELIEILKFLNPFDQLAVSKTCTYFQSLCEGESSLWRSFKVKLVDEIGDNEAKYKRLFEDKKEILEIIDHRMHNIYVNLDCWGITYYYEKRLRDVALLELLKTKSENWELKTFYFHILNMNWYLWPTSNPNISRQSAFSKSAMQFISNCLNHNQSLETLSLTVSWNSSTSYHYRQALFPMLRSAPFCGSLKSLSLDSLVRGVLDERCHNFHKSRQMYELVCSCGEAIGKFKNLQKLSIHSGYLTDSLIEGLSEPGHVGLQSMTLVFSQFCYLSHPVTSWKKLLKSSPALKVTIEGFYEKFLFEDFPLLVPPCVPIVNWNMFRCPRNQLPRLLKLLCFYAHTLESVICCDMFELVSSIDLCNMLLTCSKVRTLQFHGYILSSTILEVASMQRQWLKIGFLDKNIAFPMRETISRKQQLNSLCTEVSRILGYEWKPDLQSDHCEILNNYY